MKKILSIIITLLFVFSCVSLLGFNVKAESKIETPKPMIETPDPVIGISGKDIYKSSDITNNRKSIEPSLLRDDPLAETFTPKSDNSFPALAEERKESFTPLPDIEYVSDDSSETMLSKRNDSIDSDKDFEPGVVLVGLRSSSTKLSPKEKFSELDIVKAQDQDELLYEAVSVSSSVKKSRIEKLKKETGTNYILKLANKNKKSVLEAIEILKQDPDVEYAIPNYAIEPCVTPNDFNNYNLWGMTRIQAPQAWDSYTGGGAAVNVGIVDTGIDNNHPDLKDNVNMTLAYDAQNKNSINTMDYHSHGTHVAGTVGAKGNNTIGVVGVNWNVRLVPIKIVIDNSGTGAAYITAMVEAVRYAIRNNIPICNMSYGTPDYAPFIDAIRDYNGLFVISAGNDGENIDNSNTYTTLNSLGNVLFVASSNNATGENEALSGFSNYGIKNAHISAPGENIISTVPGGGYSSKSGTSMAAPHVAGVAALIRGRYPALTTAQLKDAILTGADSTPKIAGLVSTGKLNAYSAVNRSSDPSYLVFRPNNNETMKAAITRCLGTKSASGIKSIKILGSAIMAPGRSGADSASAVLPNLVNIDLSSFTGKINKYAFYNCTNLTTAIFPLSDFAVPSYCFMGCSKLKTIYRANNITRTLGEADFTGLLSVNIGSPFAVQTQGFQGCTSLTTIRMPNTTKLRFSQYVFSDCSSLTTVYLDTHPKVTGEIDLTEFVEIHPLVFKGTGMTSLKLPKDIEIQSAAFQNCTNLKSIQVHPSQTATVTVGSQAFYNVHSACEVFMNQGLYNMSSFIFPRTATVNIPKRINSLVVRPVTNEKMADAIRWYLGSTAATSIKHLSLIGSAAMGDTSGSESESILPNLETADLSSFTGTLGSDSFYNCTKLKTVTSNTSFTYVPAACFMYCSSLKTIFVSDKYPKIWGEADLTNLSGGIATDTQSFEACTSLTTLRIPSAQIGIAGSFYNCTRLSTIYKSGDNKSSGVFDLTGISTFWPGFGHNFVGTSVSTVKLPKNIDISEKCFFNCLNLNRIEFDSSQTNAVNIGSQAFYNVRSTCKAFMHPTLVNNSSFQLPRTATINIPKKNY